MGDALRKAALVRAHPVRQRARRRRKSRPLADAERKPGHEQRRQSADHAGPHRRRRHQQRAQKQREARPHAVAEPSAGDLEEGIGIGKRGKCDAELGCGKAEVLLHDRRRGRNIDPIDIENEVHQADREQDKAARLVPHDLHASLPRTSHLEFCAAIASEVDRRLGMALVLPMVQGEQAMAKSILCIATIRGIYH